MMNLKTISDKTKDRQHWQPPLLFRADDTDHRSQLEALIAAGEVDAVYDEIERAVSELYDIDYPEQKDHRNDVTYDAFVKKVGQGDLATYGTWVYYPWSRSAVHFPPIEDLRALRTSRNRHLIRADEQRTLYGKTILIAGLSVGSNAVEMLVSQGIGGKLILVDMDILEPTNLNRIKTTYLEVGTHKVDLVAKRVSEIDPYIEQVHYRDGLDRDSLVEILEVHKPDVLIDEMDSLDMKLEIRQHAKDAGLPVLMATDDGENALLDIERYDLDPNLELFHGRLPAEIIDRIRTGKLSRPEIGQLIGKYFVGFEHIPLRMFESLMDVGKGLPSWPQLAGAATMAGVTLAYATKKILLGQPFIEGRHIFDLDAEMDPVVKTPEYMARVKKFWVAPKA